MANVTDNDPALQWNLILKCQGWILQLLKRTPSCTVADDAGNIPDNVTRIVTVSEFLYVTLCIICINYVSSTSAFAKYCSACDDEFM